MFLSPLDSGKTVLKKPSRKCSATDAADWPRDLRAVGEGVQAKD
jgi:hypothetical protein